jgi:Domain of unknown function (DUF5668)
MRSDVNENTMHEPRGVDAGKLAVGVMLLAFGLLFLFDRLFWIDAGEVFRLWPLWLMAFGVIRILFPASRHCGRGSRLGGFWPLLIGSIFLLDTLNVLALHDSWPLFIAGAGLLMVLRAMGGGRGRAQARG